MKWGIIGMGDIADKVMAPAMTNSDEHELFAVMRRDPILAEELGRKHGASKIYTNLDSHGTHIYTAQIYTNPFEHIYFEKPK